MTTLLLVKICQDFLGEHDSIKQKRKQVFHQGEAPHLPHGADGKL